MTGSPYVRCHARARRSEPALLAEYGELGAYGVDSLKRPVSPSEPNTSSVETCTSRKAARREALDSRQYRSDSCRTVNVPTTFVLTNAAGPSIDRSTCDSAARWSTASGWYCWNTWRNAGASQMSTCWNTCLGWSAASASDSRLPAYVRQSTSTTRWSVCSMSCRTSADPMKPAPPVMRYVDTASTLEYASKMPQAAA